MTTASLAFAGGSRHDGDGKVQIPQVTLQHRGQDADLDLGASGPSIGARFVFSANLVRNGKRVGVGAGDCVIVLFRPGPDPQGEPEALTDQGVATLSLPKGQITAQGPDHRGGWSTGPAPADQAGHHRRHRCLPYRPREPSTSGPNE